MLPARTTELARTADLHILYRRAASKEKGAITPERKAELWAQAEKQVPPIKEKEIMVDTLSVKSEPEPEVRLRFEALKDDNGAHVWRYIEAVQVEIRRSGYPQLRFRLQDSFTFRENENLWISGFTEDANALAKRGVDISSWKVAGEYPVEPNVLVMVGYENMGKRDFRFRIREYEAENGEKPAPAPIDADEPVAIERPGGEHTIGTVVVNPKNPAPDGMVAVQVAPGMVEAAQTVEVHTLESVLRELVEERNVIARERDELKAQLAALHANQQMTSLARTGGAVEVCYFCEVVNTMGNQTDAAHKLGALRSEGWSIVYEQFIIDNGWTKHHVARLERQTRSVELKQEDKPGNVTTFPVPDAELTTEDDSSASALACVPAAKGIGNGGGVRRVGGMR